MKTHTLKCWGEFFAKIVSGEKQFELRKNDRDFQVGDKLQLLEYWPTQEIFTKREAHRTIGYILHHDDFLPGLMPGYVILGFKIEQAEVRW